MEECCPSDDYTGVFLDTSSFFSAYWNREIKKKKFSNLKRLNLSLACNLCQTFRDAAFFRFPLLLLGSSSFLWCNAHSGAESSVRSPPNDSSSTGSPGYPSLLAPGSTSYKIQLKNDVYPVIRRAIYSIVYEKKKRKKKIVVQKRDFYNVMLYISVSRCSCWIDGRAGRQTHLVSFLFSFLIHPHGAAPFSGLNWEQYVIITSGRQQLQQHH